MKDKSVSSLSIAEEFSLNIRKERRKTKIIQFAPVIVLLALIVLFASTNSAFISFANLEAILNQLATPLILALGLTFVVLMGSIDLSVDGVMGFSGSVVSLLVLNNTTDINLGFFGIVITVMAGAMMGGITGLIHVKAKLPSFMVSFGMTSLAAGLGLLSYGGQPATIEAVFFRDIALKSWGLPIITWIAIGMFIIAFVIQKYTAFGSYLFAIGDNEAIPRITGINVDRTKIKAFMWSGLCFALAGIIGAARLGRGTVLIGQGNLFPAMTAVVVGGTALSGGKGGVVNTLLGALIVTVLKNGLILMGVDPFIQAGIQGVIIIVAVSLTVTRDRKLINK